MTLREAWEILGKDPDRIMQLLSDLPDVKSRAEATGKILEKARKLARNLMAKNHPDVNPDNPAASDKFKEIQEALSTIESHTKKFQAKVEGLTTRKIAKNDVVIVVGKQL
jgi:hypothetical protein